ncbi:MAG: hypothetical protein KC636_26315 [Myxococcales bacterium]|nr:hypothetical protein [Myxococcales bacterium]
MSVSQTNSQPVVGTPVVVVDSLTVEVAVVASEASPVVDASLSPEVVLVEPVVVEVPGAAVVASLVLVVAV